MVTGNIMSNEFLRQLDNSNLGYVVGLFCGFVFILSNELVQIHVLKFFKSCGRWCCRTTKHLFKRRKNSSSKNKI